MEVDAHPDLVGIGEYVSFCPSEVLVKKKKQLEA